jgi:hypothetical protein
MKQKSFSFKPFGLALGLIFLASCGSEECADCHVVADINGMEYEILELGEYCEDALHEIEEDEYVILDTIIIDADGHELPSPVLPGDAVEVHCGEEHDH